jgi:hypothetical protein
VSLLTDLDAFFTEHPRLTRALAILGALVVLVAAAIAFNEVRAWATCGVGRIEAEARFLRPDWMPRDERTVAEARKREGQEAYERCYREKWWRERD